MKKREGKRREERKWKRGQPTKRKLMECFFFLFEIVKTEGLFIQSGPPAAVGEIIDAFDRGFLFFSFSFKICFLKRIQKKIRIKIKTKKEKKYFNSYFNILTINFSPSLQNTGEAVKIRNYTEDPVVIADVLLTFLRRLPDPIIPLPLQTDILKTVGMTGGKKAQIQHLRSVCDRLPDLSHSLLEALLSFLNRYCNSSKCMLISFLLLLSCCCYVFWIVIVVFVIPILFLFRIFFFFVLILFFF